MTLFACAALLAAAISPSYQASEYARQFEAAKAAVVRSAVATVTPAMVTIETVGGAQPVRRTPRGTVEEPFRLADGPCTGLIITPDGLILTSSFNFARDPSVITVRLADDRRFVATLLAKDEIRRLALLRVDARDLPTARWVPSAEMRVGQYAIACGNGLGASEPFASLGIVSALGRRNGLAIQTDAKTSPINYGGPLIDIEGRVLGLILPMAGAGGGALAGVDWYDSGIGFAIPRHRIEEVLNRLRSGENIEPGKIGVILGPREPGPLDAVLEELFPQSRGVRIISVADPSPAKRAELQPEDVITALDSHPIGELSELQRRLSDRAAGEEITLSIKRRWRSFDVPITLARMAEIGRFEEPPAEETPPSEEQPPEAPAPSTQPDTD